MAPHIWLNRIVQDNPDARADALAEMLWPIVCARGFASQWLHHRLALMALHPAELPRGYADPVLQSLVLVDDGRVHLSLAMISADGWQARMADRHGAKSIVEFVDGWTRLRFLVADDIWVQRHLRVPSNISRRAWAEEPCVVRGGEEFLLDNATEALRFSHVGADAVLVRMMVRDPMATQAIECDADSGAVLRVRQAQSHEGRTRMTVSLLRSLQINQALQVIRDSLGQWSPHLRWHGVMEALAIDSQAGFELLEAMMRDDPDAGLRRQAAQTRATLLTRYPELAAMGGGKHGTADTH